MAEQIQKPKAKKKQEEPEETKPADLKAKGEELKKDADDLMDEIDDILEQNCEEFVKNYVQRGGQ